MARGLPYGRGFTDDPVLQDQEYNRQRLSVPRRGGWSFSSRDAIHNLTYSTNSGMAVDTLYLIPMKVLDQDLLLNSVRLETGNATACDIEVGIYLYSADSQRMTLVRPSLAKFTNSVAQVHEKVFPNNGFSLLAEARYFFSCRFTTAVPQLNTMGDGSTVLVDRVYGLPSTKTLSVVNVPQITSTGTNFPVIEYYAREATRFI